VHRWVESHCRITCFPSNLPEDIFIWPLLVIKLYSLTWCIVFKASLSRRLSGKAVSRDKAFRRLDIHSKAMVAAPRTRRERGGGGGEEETWWQRLAIRRRQLGIRWWRLAIRRQQLGIQRRRWLDIRR
jgi:hypothetical protein